ncbi:PA2778 family cysteine peptidase [Crenobacter cavernae]|uniref:Peptidase C39 family protein n=1 Tax=Crenobacter cavernae TaxID=2290923 RepID=A0A345Y7J0_9NEIS|nr:PA2778 family cysteine peptidase [Crenobacter cavernae]AXK39892.1 peptidase C39 family protein [Crenobacter cavernae]
MRRAACALLLTLTLAGCATPGLKTLDALQGVPPRTELTATPFFPQQDYQCGPAALATVLVAAGRPVTPEALVDQVFLPARRGSLQIEMLAAVPRHGLVATRIPARLDALLTELAAGHPVLVMQNMGLSWAPSWHYAVAVGFDLAKKELILRSGTERRMAMPFNTFEHTWARSEHWAFVALPPGRLPATSDADRVAAGLVAFARLASPADAARGFDAALARFSDNATLAVGLAGSQYVERDLPAAEATLRAALLRHPAHPVIANNLANLLLERGRLDEAEALVAPVADADGPWRDAARATLNKVRSARTAAPAPKR